MFDSIRPLEYLWKAFCAERDSGQIAWGIALGMLIGIVPKGNLTAWIFGVVLLATRVNLGAGLFTALLVTSVSSLTDPLTHGIGARLLSQNMLRNWLANWYDTPFVPWLSWNNTVVLGSTVLGLALLYPVQHVSRATIDYIRSRFPAEPDGEAVKKWGLAPRGGPKTAEELAHTRSQSPFFHSLGPKHEELQQESGTPSTPATTQIPTQGWET